MNINVLIVGVGGQGTLLASRILGKIAENDGSDCKLSEVHGMAQRGGSVVTHVKGFKPDNLGRRRRRGACFRTTGSAPVRKLS